MRKTFAKRQKRRYTQFMFERLFLSVSLMFLLPVSGSNAQQSESQDYVTVDSAQIEVFGVSRSKGGGTENYKLPENREDWLTIADKIRQNKIDDYVSYAMQRGQPPKDIFDDELMAIFDTNYQNWLLDKWEPRMEAEERARRQEERFKEKFGDVNFEVLRDGVTGQPVCSSSLPSSEELREFQDDGSLPSSLVLNAMYRAMVNEVVCAKEEKQD